MIIVEGPDGAGKTTLVNLLSKELGLQIGKRGTADRDKLWEVGRRDTYTAISDAVGGHEPVRVWDRLYFSELIYAPVSGRTPEFSHREQFMIQRVIKALECPIILCMPPLEVVTENVMAAHQMEGVKDHITDIWGRYRVLYQHRLPHATLYDYTGQHTSPSAEPIINYCKHYLSLRRERSW